VVVLDIVVAMLLDGLGAVRTFVRNLGGGPNLLRSRRISSVWSVSTLLMSVVARYLVGLCIVRRAGYRSWVRLLLGRS